MEERSHARSAASGAAEGRPDQRPAEPQIDLSLLVPCWNEQDNVGPLVDRVAAVLAGGGLPLAGAELVLVDDGSADATWREIERAAARHGFVTGVRHPHNRGLAAAWQSGLVRARGRLVCLLDADLQYRPEDLVRLHRALVDSGADVVQGWRSRSGRAIDSRLVISRCLSALLNAAFGMRLRDNKSGFVMCRREVLADLLEHRGRYRYFQILLLVAAHAKGYRVHQVETRFEPRRAGRSFLSPLPLRVMAAALGDVLRGLVEYRLGRPRRARR